MNNLLTVQDMRITHIEAFGRMMGDMVAETPENYSVTPDYAREFGESERFRTNLIQAIRSKRGGRFVVIDGSDEMLGVVTLADKEDAMQLGNMYVVPAARMCGIGAMLLSACEERALYDDKPRITLEVGSKNIAARKLYLSHGFMPAIPQQIKPWDLHPGVFGEILSKDL